MQQARRPPIAGLLKRDGRPFRNTPAPNGPAVHPNVAGQPLPTSIIMFGAAEKFDAHVYLVASREYSGSFVALKRGLRLGLHGPNGRAGRLR